MPKYVFTNSMKRQERSDLCIKLCNEIHDNGVLDRLLKPLWNIIYEKKYYTSRPKDLINPPYALKTCTYKGTTFYLIVDKDDDYDVVFNTSPVDAAYVEFIKPITETSAIIYTQHALDRYNERIHKDKYDNHRDIIKRFIVNNPVKTDLIIDGPDNKIIQRVNEGFLCGQVDTNQTCAIMNTFFDSREYTDNEGKLRARTEFKKYVEWPKERRELYDDIHYNLIHGIINVEQYKYEMFINRFDLDKDISTRRNTLR